MEGYVRAVMDGRATGVGAGMLRGVMGVAERVYRRVMAARNRRYDEGRGVRRLERPVISVGNLSAGGTGKTPVAAYLARYLESKGHCPAVLLRGYRGGAGGSDEAAELALACGPGVVVVPDPDRVRGAAAALRDRPRTSVFLLDDGFQHRKVARDLDLVLVSARQGLCGGRLLPRGLLREPPESLARADAILLTRCDQVSASALEELMGRIGAVASGVPMFRSEHRPAELRSPEGERLEPGWLSGRPVLVVAGTGDPQAVAATVAGLGGRVRATRGYRDHHHYSERDVREVLGQGREVGAEAVVTTAKDAVKLVPLLRGRMSLDGPRFLTLHVRISLGEAGGGAAGAGGPGGGGGPDWRGWMIVARLGMDWLGLEARNSPDMAVDRAAGAAPGRS